MATSSNGSSTWIATGVPSIIVVRSIAEASSRPPEQQILLLAERRQFLKRRWRGVAEDGVEFGFDLDERLTDGSVIHRSTEWDYVIRQLPEMVYEVHFSDPAGAALAGWKIGNLHMPVEVRPDCLRAVHDPAVGALLEREGWAFREITELFNPLRAEPHV